MEKTLEHNLNIYLAADNIISSLGFTTQENVDAILSYQSGIKEDKTHEIADTDILAARIDNDKLSKLVKKSEIEKYSKAEQFVILSIQDILKQKNIDISHENCGIILATTKGNIEYLQNNTEVLDERTFLWSTANKIKEHFQLKNDITLISNACISGVSALVTARRLLQNGDYKHIIVTGVDVLSHFITSGFLSFKSISQNPCRPYDAQRDGLNLGEACGSILLTTDETPSALMLTGGVISNDANHISGPSRTGDGLYFAISSAIEEAGLQSKDIDTVNLHGTATVFNDEMEAKAIHLAELQHASINSLKSYFGHTLGASGVIESIISAYQLKNNIVFGTLNFEESGVSLPLRINSKHTYINLNNCVKTGSGFGGCNAAIVLSKENRSKNSIEKKQYAEIKNCIIENNLVTVSGNTVFSSEESNFGQFIREVFKDKCEANMKFYKMDDMSKMAYIAAEYLLEGIKFEPREMGVILANSAASLDTDIKHQAIIDKDGDEAVSPAVFVYTLPNVAAGEICIRHKIKGENTFFITEEFNPDEIKKHALMAMQKTGLKYCIYGWCEFLNNNYKADFRQIGRAHV